MPFEAVHRASLPYLPADPCTVLDIGAGSGRDAAWFAARGCSVVAVEPATPLRELARRLHPDAGIRWEDDRLPGLTRVRQLQLTFDVIWLSAVWMHLRPDERMPALRRLTMVLRPGGRIFITLRQGAADPDRPMFLCSSEELERFALQLGLIVRAVLSADDQLGRVGLVWRLVVLEMPDDATAALPVIRGVILQDAKSATYKLALLRSLLIAANLTPSIAKDRDGTVVLPLGLIALHWLRLYMPLLRAGLRQASSQTAGRRLGFIKEGFRQLTIQPTELRIGGVAERGQATALAKALRDTARTIATMPAHFIRGADGRPLLPASLRPSRIPEGSLILDEEYLWSFGAIEVPQAMWLSFRRHALWIEPVIIQEWVEQMARFGAHGTIDRNGAYQLLQWVDPRRDTTLVRTLCAEMMQNGEPIWCVWTGKRLELRDLQVDHCFPFAIWPCDDLWNLLPSSAAANAAKGGRIVSGELLARRSDMLADWWSRAFLKDSATSTLRRRFTVEATASLPMASSDAQEAPDVRTLLDGVDLVRLRLRGEQRVPEWAG